MARIRTIKPEFWTDSLMVQFDAMTRLIYIGLWSCADDHGALQDEPDRLAMEIMPRENPDEVMARIDLLVGVGRLTRMVSDDGSSYLQIEKWLDHQRVDRPSKSRIVREGSRKSVIPQEVRRKVATKYGCTPGDGKDVTCYFCGQPGSIHWWRLSSGKPSAWVSFGGLHLDHFHPEFHGGATDESNLVLSCEGCNKSRRNRSAFEFVAARVSVPELPLSQAQAQFDANIREHSRALVEGKGSGTGSGNGKGEEKYQQRTEPLGPAAMLDNLEDKCRSAAGLDNDPSPGLLRLDAILALLDAGWSLDKHILPALRSAKASGKRGSSWGYYAKIITNGHTTPPKAAPPPSAEPASLPSPSAMAAAYVAINKWMWPTVPEPGRPGCPVTADMIEQARRDQADKAQRMVTSHKTGAAA